MANNQFLVSVAKAIARDPNTGAGIFLGKTNISSAFTLSMQKVEVRGGINNPLLYVYYHTRAVEIKVEDATFNKTFLGLNVGQLTTTGLVDVIETECITLVGNVGTTTSTPLSDIAVYMNDGTIQNVTPVGKTFTVVSGGSTSVDVVYTINTTADQIAIATATPPSVVDMVLIAEVRDSTGVIVNYLQISIPRFQISGNYTLSLAANGVSNQSLDGYALAVNSTDCVSGTGDEIHGRKNAHRLKRLRRDQPAFPARHHHGHNRPHKPAPRQPAHRSERQPHRPAISRYV